MLAAGRGGRDWEGVEPLVGEDDERPHEIVPAREEDEEREGADDRGQDGEDDAAQDRALARAVDARCLQHLVGDRQAILADEEDAEEIGRASGRGRVWQYV